MKLVLSLQYLIIVKNIINSCLTLANAMSWSSFAFDGVSKLLCWMMNAITPCKLDWYYSDATFSGQILPKSKLEWRFYKTIQSQVKKILTHQFGFEVFYYWVEL